MVNSRDLMSGGRRLLSALVAKPNVRGRPQASYKRGIPAKMAYQQMKGRNRVIAQIQQREMERMREKGYTLEQARRMPERELIRRMPLSANTITILDRIRQIQNQGRIDKLEMARRIKERRIVNNAMSLLKTPSLFGPESNTFNILEEANNPVKAPNLFKERTDVPNLMNTKRLSLLNTREAGNDLHF